MRVADGNVAGADAIFFAPIRTAAPRNPIGLLAQRAPVQSSSLVQPECITHISPHQGPNSFLDSSWSQLSAFFLSASHATACATIRPPRAVAARKAEEARKEREKAEKERRE